MSGLVTILATIAFSGAAATAIGTIAVTVAPQRRRILSLVAQGLAVR